MVLLQVHLQLQNNVQLLAGGQLLPCPQIRKLQNPHGVNGTYGNAHLLCESTHFGGIVCQDRFYQRICTVIISAFVPDVQE